LEVGLGGKYDATNVVCLKFHWKHVSLALLDHKSNEH